MTPRSAPSRSSALAASGPPTAAGEPGYEPGVHFLTAFEGVTITWHDLGPMGETDFETSTISLRRGLQERELRSVLAHELVHLERGPACAGTAHLEEFLVEATAAVRLIPACVLADLPALVSEHGLNTAVAFLGVDRGTILTAIEGIDAATRRNGPPDYEDVS